jgi:hypothetical protein
MAEAKKQMGVEQVEPISDSVSCHPPVLKITRGVLIRLENFLLQLISQRLTKIVL